MTIDDLLDPAHSSKPGNKLIAQIFYDMGIIERYGSGIQRMIDECIKAGLPEPVFEKKFGGFAITFKKDILTEEYLNSIRLNKRQIAALKVIKTKHGITNKDYSEMFEINDRTALRDLQEMCSKNILERLGRTGRATRYILKKPDKPDINRTKKQRKELFINEFFVKSPKCHCYETKQSEYWPKSCFFKIAS